ncbi:hypothetical protein KFL_011590020 [Klebsormidium nitens]|uniref:Uncharacterized protein n=1 Tax=Klebsormidium nitens TaxID=105231 RepID=A0A1Y1IX32_KLENI|nr:hypothetical protein KFL_011590020 [Klebsormidium nitens]|eukprot:GAQ92828.1 hypothetical protein KFL_011590020 [Klebsormidium nitens]
MQSGKKLHSLLQCFSSDGSRFTCCPVGVSCAQPGSVPRCVGFASLADAPTPITPAPTTPAPTTSAPTTSAPTTSAPTTSAPTTSAPTTAEPVTPAPTTLAATTAAPTTPAPTTAGPVTPSPTFVTGSAPCNPFSPNQCFNAGGSLFTCCAGACSSTPGDAPVCA